MLCAGERGAGRQAGATRTSGEFLQINLQSRRSHFVNTAVSPLNCVMLFNISWICHLNSKQKEKETKGQGFRPTRMFFKAWTGLTPKLRQQSQCISFVFMCSETRNQRLVQQHGVVLGIQGLHVKKSAFFSFKQVTRFNGEEFFFSDCSCENDWTLFAN